MVVPSTEPDRIGLSTHGLVLNLEARVPTGVNHANIFGVSLLPKLETKEEATQATFSSGNLDSAHAVEIAIGSEHIIDRKQQFFWKLSHRLQKHVYEGATIGNDPVTGSTLEGVSVTKGTTLFQFGFSWGD